MSKKPRPSKPAYLKLKNIPIGRFRLGASSGLDEQRIEADYNQHNFRTMFHQMKFTKFCSIFAELICVAETQSCNDFERRMLRTACAYNGMSVEKFVKAHVLSATFD